MLVELRRRQTVIVINFIFAKFELLRPTTESGDESKLHLTFATTIQWILGVELDILLLLPVLPASLPGKSSLCK